MIHIARLHSAIGGIASDYRSRVREFESQPGHITFAVIDHETFFAAIPQPTLMQEGQLSAVGENVYLVLINRLVGLRVSLPGTV